MNGLNAQSTGINICQADQCCLSLVTDANMTTELKQWSKFSKRASKPLKGLRPVFKKLKSVHERYINGENKSKVLSDCGFWFHERPHIGFLAAAVWQSNGTALEEYGADKEGVKNKWKRGRCDLWIRTKSIYAACEAKCVWLNLKADDVKSIEKINKQVYDRLKELT